jgi:hypothetical protein
MHDIRTLYEATLQSGHSESFDYTQNKLREEALEETLHFVQGDTPDVPFLCCLV